jgi:hypothetical protein
LIVICFVFYPFLDCFFNFISQHLISFNFYIILSSYSFNCYFFILFLIYFIS